ncbi:probable peroxygenase 5 [Miscanthus floridulus]
MDVRRQRPSSCSWAAAAPLLLLLAVSFGGHHPAAAAADGAVGAPAPGAAGMTELQKHVAFFDRDHDGIITFDETYQGLRDVGVGEVTAKASAALINGALGPKTRPDNANSSRMDIYIENIQKGKHGSDTGAYDAQGRFVPAKFDEIFSKHAKTVPNALTKDELDEMLKDNQEKNDFAGWLAAKSEWEMLYKVAKDKDGRLPKDTVRAVYDGTLFYQLTAQGKKA